MTYFVIGGSGSGKSHFAESIINNSPIKNRTYIATMRVWDLEGEKRVEKHRKMRQNKGFDTLEIPVELEKIHDLSGCILLEDLTNLFMNEWYGEASESAFARVCQGLEKLHKSAELFVIVANDIFTDGVNYGPETEELLAQLGKINTFTASLSDEVFEVSCGIETKIDNKFWRSNTGMTLIIGGKYQGKRYFAQQFFDSGRGLTDNFEISKNSDIFSNLEQWIKDEENPIERLEALLEINPNITIICDEVGCGVVPMDKSEREWREKVGRTCTFLAEKATKVIRITCGIPHVLKDE